MAWRAYSGIERGVGDRSSISIRFHFRDWEGRNNAAAEFNAVSRYYELYEGVMG